MNNIPPAVGILAAGMGSRYGGLKQADPVYGDHILLEYTVFDALKSGFGKVILLIREDFESGFMESYGDRIVRGAGVFGASVEFAYQESVDELPGYRKKMWGTGHALLCMEDAADRPFAVVNADDYYGRDSFQRLHAFFTSPEYDPEGSIHAIIGFRLKNVLSEFGPVARGVCSIDREGNLDRIDEITDIRKENGAIVREGGDKAALDPEAVTSMNFWGFNPTVFGPLRERFRQFLDDVERTKEPKREFFLPQFVSDEIARSNVRVKVLPTDAQWFGMTYHDDRAYVKERIARLTAAGFYPENLWDS